MSVVHIPEAEAIRDFGAVLARIDAGDDVIVDRSGSYVCIVPPQKGVRTVGEMREILKSLPGERGLMDEAFAEDVRGFRERTEAFDSTRWD